MSTELFDISSVLNSDQSIGQIDRVVGNSVVYVSLKGGELLGLQPERILVRSVDGTRRYDGQKSFRSLGLVNGAVVKVFGHQDPETPDCLVVDVDDRPSLLHRLFPIG